MEPLRASPAPPRSNGCNSPALPVSRGAVIQQESSNPFSIVPNPADASVPQDSDFLLPLPVDKERNRRLLPISGDCMESDSVIQPWLRDLDDSGFQAWDTFFNDLQ